MMQYLKGSDTLREMYPKVNENFENIDDQLKTHEQNFEDIDDRLNAHEQNFGNIEENIQQIETNLQDISDSFNAHKDEYAAYKNSNNLEIAKIKKEIADYKAAMALLNPNHEAKQAVEGYGIVNLPPNCANGQVSGVVRGLTATNLVENGDFSADFNNWSDGSISDGKLVKTFSADTSQNFLFYKKPRTINEKYYSKLEFKIISGSIGRIRFLTGGVPREIDVPELNQLVVVSDAQTSVSEGGSFIQLTLLDISAGTQIEIYNAFSINLTQTFGAGNEPTKEECDKIFTNYFNGAKSTISAFRIRSVSQDESQESTAYVLAKDAEGKILELRSLPNGVKDEVRVSDNKFIKKVGISKPFSEVVWYRIADADTANYYGLVTSYTALEYYGIRLAATPHQIIGDIYYEPMASYALYRESDTLCYRLNSETELYLKIPKSVFPNGWSLEESQAWFEQNQVTLIYQLAEPVEVPIQISGTLVGYPSGTVYIEPIVADAGIYNDGIDVLHQDLPIKQLERLSKVDFTTGVEIPLDVGEVEIDEDRLSFTHPELETEDIVFFTYEYDREGTIPEAEIEYYDSRYVVKDSITDKFYKWHITIADGVPSIELVEV